MRKISLVIGTATCLALPASAEPVPPVLSLDNPAYSDPTRKWTSIEDAQADADGVRIILPEDIPLDIRDPSVCRDKIEQARAANGQPPLFEREPASPNKPYRIYAVDRRQDGCSVMVIMGNPNDIRPLPERAEGPTFVLIPAADADAEQAASDGGK